MLNEREIKELAESLLTPFPADADVIVETVGGNQFATYKGDNVFETKYEIHYGVGEVWRKDDLYKGKDFEHVNIAVNFARPDGSVDSCNSRTIVFKNE